MKKIIVGFLMLLLSFSGSTFAQGYYGYGTNNIGKVIISFNVGTPSPVIVQSVNGCPVEYYAWNWEQKARWEREYRARMEREYRERIEREHFEHHH